MVLLISFGLYNLYYIFSFCKNNPKYKDILNINKKYSFNKDVPENFTIIEFCDTKKQYDNFDFNLFIYNAYLNNQGNLRIYYEKTKENINLYNVYKKEFNDYLENNFKEDAEEKAAIYFNKVEKFICKRKFINHRIDFGAKIVVKYVSPQGRNSYTKSVLASFINIHSDVDYFKKAKNRREYYKRSAFIERSKMSKALRYQVLKRDHFRCQACGASGKDVELHVDHIIPVSKGGKTELSNLQTLCRDCNLGKGNRF